MSSISRSWRAGGRWAVLAGAALTGSGLAVACGDGTAGDLFSNDAGLFEVPPAGGRSGLGGRGGRGGSSGVGGRAGTGGAAGAAGEADAGLDAGGSTPDAGPGCDPACIDDNECTVDGCDSEGNCTHAPRGAGEACGSGRDDACTSPDSCDGNGVCLPNDGADGAACPGGSCTAGECIDGQPVGCPADVVSAVPFSTDWRTVGGTDFYDGTCDGPGTPEFAVVFTAPGAGLYRFAAAGVVGTGDPENAADDSASELADSVLTIAEGSCGGRNATQVDCNDDAPGNTLDSRVDLQLTAGQSVTVYVNEFHEVLPGGGSGTLTITQLPD
jgi:hypothetical protein